MSLRKGLTNNLKGRPVGVPNRVTAEVKEIINQFINNNIGNLQNDFNNLESKDKLRFLIDLLPYIVPKLTSVEVKEPEPEKEPVTIVFVDFDNDGNEI